MKRFFRSLTAVLLMLVTLISTASALTVEQALDLLEEHYVRDLPEYVYEAETLDELFELLGDPYTYHMSAEDQDAFQEAVEGTVSLVGIGVSIQYTEEGILISEILKHGPAEEAGLQAGDVIIAVDGESCVPANESHRNGILGEEGTYVTLTIRREGLMTDYRLKRALVVIPNTEISILENHIGYIQCSSFGSDTGELFLDAVTSSDSAVDCWLVDVRGNTGGYTEAAVEALGVFGGPGYHVYLRTGQGALYYYVYNQSRSTEQLAVVLTDSATASAAEAFSGGMRDLRTGLIVGSRTYGKGVAQVIYDRETYPELFADDALKVTAYQFYSNGGLTSNYVGVIPTLMVSDEAAYDVALAICGSSDILPQHLLQLDIDGWTISLDTSKMSEAALSALFEALPPGAVLWLREEGIDTAYPFEEVARRLGVEYESRWFEDVGDSMFASEINTLATYGIVHGDGNGHFDPHDTITRAEACAMLAKALGLKGSQRQRFTDVREDDTNAPYINAMAELGFVVGMGDGRFCPEQAMSQQELYVMLARVARYLDLNLDLTAETITDEHREMAVELGFRSWAYDSAVLMAMTQAFYDVDGALSPTEPILREEAAASLWAVLVNTGILPD